SLAACKAASFGAGGLSAAARTAASSLSERRTEQVASGAGGWEIAGLPPGWTPVSVLSTFYLLSLPSYAPRTPRKKTWLFPPVAGRSPDRAAGPTAGFPS